MKNEKLKPMQEHLKLLIADGSNIISQAHDNSSTDEIDRAIENLSQCNTIFKQKVMNIIN